MWPRFFHSTFCAWCYRLTAVAWKTILALWRCLFCCPILPQVWWMIYFAMFCFSRCHTGQAANVSQWEGTGKFLLCETILVLGPFYAREKPISRICSSVGLGGLSRSPFQFFLRTKFFLFNPLNFRDCAKLFLI